MTVGNGSDDPDRTKRIDVLKQQAEEIPGGNGRDDPEHEKRIEELKRQAVELTGEEVAGWKSDDLTLEMEEEFLQGVVAYEAAPWTTHYQQLEEAGVELPDPETMDDEKLTAKLWEVIEALARMRVFLESTNHLSVRELYTLLWSDVLQEEVKEMVFDEYSAWHIDLIGSGSDEDIHLWMKYYADDETRRQWMTDWPDYEINGEELRCLYGHVDQVRSVEISSDGRRIISGSDDNTVRLWDAESGEELRCLRGDGWSIAISSDWRRIVSKDHKDHDDTVRVWDADSGEEMLSLRGHEDSIRSVAISSDARVIVSGANDNTVRVWDAENGEELLCLRGHKNSVTSVEISNDGRRIISGSYDNTVRVWDAESGQELLRLLGLERDVRSVEISSDGHRIAGGSWDDTVRVWDAESGQCLEIIEGQGDVQAIAAGSVTFPFRAIARGPETVIDDTTGRLLGWFPVYLDHLTTHPSGRLWAGASGDHLSFISLEGVPN